MTAISRHILATVWVVLLSTSAALAQSATATLSGQIKDPSGLSLPGASINVRNDKTNIVRSTRSDSQGIYTVPLLLPGSYEVNVEASGFTKVIRRGIILQVGQTANVDFSLRVGASTDLITVTADASLAETETSSIDAVITNRQVESIPLNGRQFYSLAYLVPGVAPPVQSSTNGYRGGFNVAGSSEIANNFTLDGLKNNDGAINGPTYRSSIDAIQEFNLLTGVYAAEYGQNSGGQVVVTTKSGTNELHGSLFDFVRNQTLDATNYFSSASAIPSFSRNQFGGTVSAPILRNKSFFFFSYEGLRLSQQVTALSTVPTAAERKGDFTALPITLHDPTTGATIGNTIQPAQFNAIGAAILSYYPLPTATTPAGSLPSNNYTFNELRTESLDQFTLRLDHTFSAKDTLFATLNHANDPSFEPSNSTCGSRTLPGFGCTVGLTTQLYGLGETHIFTPHLINQLRLGYTRLRQPRTAQDGNDAFDQRYGITAVYGTYYGGVPATSITSYTLVGSQTNLPQDRADNADELVDAVLWTKGKHAFKFGGDVWKFGSNYLNMSNSVGSFTFSNTSSGPTTGYGLADLLLGLPATTSRNPYAPKFYPRTTSAAVYAQDDYKVLSNLTVNYGLRWEVNTPIGDRFGKNSNFDPATGAIVYPGNNGYTHNLYNTQLNAFGPRLGLAWRPFRTNDTVIRVGSGIYYNSQATNNGISGLSTNPPFRQPQTFTSTKLLPISLSNPYPDANLANSTTLTGINRNFKNAYVAEWSLGVQQSFGTNIALDITYFGSSGSHLPVNHNINQPAAGTGTTAQVNARRPYPTFGNIGFIDSVDKSSFNALETKLEKRYADGLSLLVSYTWSKSIDNGPGITTGSAASSSNPQNAYYLAGERGRSDFDIRNRIVINPIWDLPLGKGRQFATTGLPSKLIGGFNTSAIFTAQDGNPQTASYSGNISNTYNNSDRPNLVGDPNSGPKTKKQWFNTAAFALPGTAGVSGCPSSSRCAFGNEGRNVINGPGLWDLDFAVSRDFSVRERVKIQARGELFNALNHPNFNFPVATADSSSFGSITSALDPRQIQFALRAIF